MSSRTFRKSAEGFALTSAVFGVLLAALLAQTRLMVFGSFKMMAAVFVSADVFVYLLMKSGIINSPGAGGQQKS